MAMTLLRNENFCLLSSTSLRCQYLHYGVPKGFFDPTKSLEKMIMGKWRDRHFCTGGRGFNHGSLSLSLQLSVMIVVVDWRLPPDRATWARSNSSVLRFQ